MKRSRKSLVALLLVLCMAMTFVVPAAFAEELTLKYEFGLPNMGNLGWPENNELSYWNDTAFTFSNPQDDPDTESTEEVTKVRTDAEKGLSKSSYVGKNQDRYIQMAYNDCRVGSRQTTFRFNGENAWAAVKIYGVKAGTYKMTFTYGTGIVDQNVLVKVVTGDEYNAAIKDDMALLKMQSASGSSSSLLNTSFNKDNAELTLPGSDTKAKKQMTHTSPQVTFEKDGSEVGEYVLIFINTAGSNAFYLRRMSMTGTLASAPAPTNPVAKIGNAEYTSLGAALDAAQSGDEIDLAADVSDAGNFTVPSGVTLDLNGKNLTAGDINVAGTLKDSASAGVLTANITCTNGNGGWLPLTNGSGKTLFKLKATSLGVAEKTEDTAKFGFNVHFENTAAYAKAGNTAIKVLMTWDGGSANATAPETFVSNWASTNSGNGKAIGVTVNGLTGVANFKLQPVVEVNGVTVNLDAIALS